MSLSESQLDAAMVAMDTDGDGGITFSEFHHWVTDSFAASKGPAAVAQVLFCAIAHCFRVLLRV